MRRSAPSVILTGLRRWSCRVSIPLSSLHLSLLLYRCQRSDRRIKLWARAARVTEPAAFRASHIPRRQHPPPPGNPQVSNQEKLLDRIQSEPLQKQGDGDSTIYSWNKPHSHILPQPIRESVNSANKSLRGVKNRPEKIKPVQSAALTMAFYTMYKTSRTSPALWDMIS